METDYLQFWQHPARVRLAVTMPRASRRGLKLREHQHPFHELGFLLEGECHWHLGNNREHLRVGDLLIVPAAVSHHEKTPPRTQARIGWIGFDFTDNRTAIPTPLSGVLQAGEYHDELRRLFDVVCAEHQGQALGHAERAELALREILILLCRLPASAQPAAQTEPRAGRAAQLARSAALTLTGNLAQPLRIRDLANYHSLTPSHFTRLFRQHVGENPQRHLQNARIARAKTLLRENKLTVKEIAAACGYRDSAHFCHTFKTATELTPKQYRKTPIPD